MCSGFRISTQWRSTGRISARQLKEQKERTSESQKEQSVFATVMTEAQVKLNSAAVSKRYNETIADYEAQAKMLGGNLSSMAQQYGTGRGRLKRDGRWLPVKG